MPLSRGRDTKGAYYRWGRTGAKYHYTAGNKISRDRARAKAMRQARAIQANRYGSGAAKRAPTKQTPATRMPTKKAPATKTGGRAPSKARKTISSADRARKKVADKDRLRHVAAYRRVATKRR